MLSVGSVQAAESAATMYFIKLYSATCLKSGANVLKLREILQAQRLPKVTEHEAAPFLKGNPGVVWAATAPFGTYAIVSRDDGLCAVIAQKADAKELDTVFSSFIER